MLPAPLLAWTHHARSVRARPAWRVLAALAATVSAAVSSGMDTRASERAAGPSGHSTALFHATAYAGSIEVALALSGTPEARRAVSARLSQFRPGTTPTTVNVDCGPVSKSPSGSRRMILKNGTYRSTVTMPPQGTWRLRLHLESPGSKPVSRDVSFLVRWSVGGTRPEASLVPMFTPTTAGMSVVELPVGPFDVTLTVAIGALGAARFLLRFHALRPRAPPPARVTMQTAMLDMAMGESSDVARRLGPGRYAARAFFSMPGAWAVSVVIPRARAAAALIVGHQA